MDRAVDPERQRHVAGGVPVVAGAGELLAQRVAGGLDHLVVEGDPQAVEREVGLRRGLLSDHVAVLAEPGEVVLVVIGRPAHVVHQLVVRVLAVGGEHEVLACDEAEQHAQEAVPDVEEAAALGDVDQDLGRVARVVQRLDHRLAEHEAPHRRRLAHEGDRRLEVRVVGEDQVGPLGRLVDDDVDRDHVVEGADRVPHLLLRRHVPDRVRVVGEQHLRPVVEVVFLGVEHRVDGDVAGVHAEREPLHHLQAVRRELERHRRVEDPRVRLQHPVLALLDEEAADVERHAEVAARHVDVAEEGVHHLQRHRVQAAALVRDRAAVVVHGRGPVRVRLAVELDRLADAGRLAELFREPAHRRRRDGADLLHHLGGVAVQDVEEQLEAGRARDAFDLVAALERDLAQVRLVPLAGASGGRVPDHRLAVGAQVGSRRQGRSGRAHSSASAGTRGRRARARARGCASGRG